MRRRKFLETISVTAIASALPKTLRASTQRDKNGGAKAAVFWENDFPTIDGCAITRDVLQQALDHFEVTLLSESDLIARLNVRQFDLLVTPFGSAFPKGAWRTVLEYLRAGGNWLNLGGVPLAVPVVREGSRWRAEVPQAAYHQKLGFTQSFPVQGTRIASYITSSHFEGQGKLENACKAERVYELYARLTSTSDTPDESGSDGPREAILYPLLFGIGQDKRRVAAPIIQIDRLLGDFAGGRWVLANFSGSLSAGAISSLADWAAQGALEFRAGCEFACYRVGEAPSFFVRVVRLAGNPEKIAPDACRLEVRDGSNQIVSQLSVPLEKHGRQLMGYAKLPANIRLGPGFYSIHAQLLLTSITGGSKYELAYMNGFWIYDQSLMKRGWPLTVDRHSFYRDDESYPVTGTTYMASDVHRKFLFDPNPLVWERDFREMKEAGINMIRTGIWTGWKKYMPEAGKVDEAALRALDAFLLTAHKYDIPVIFTFFAFLPETWGGQNAYLDPAAVRAQEQFVSAFAQRYRDLDDLIWDLINEPSFCSPKHLWSCRPNYDSHEKAAWQEWLKGRYPNQDDEARAATLQQLWRTTGDDAMDLPRLEDFDNVNILEARRPLKTLDYRLFAQEMFARWVRTMTAAIKSSGNRRQLITVGQDEAGAGDSPNPQFFADAVDFTCIHNWWANDDLVWDSVITKAHSKASLVEETGIMFYEKTDSAAWRTEEEARNLLERKLAIGAGTDSAGFIEWIWNTNCYMNSDNEAAIGFHRVDQTAKPELEPFLEISKFYASHRGLLRDRLDEPVLMVIPHSQMFSPRNTATESTRKCVRALHYHCRTSVRAVSEYLLFDSKEAAKLIVVPAPRVLSQRCWASLLRRAEQGATVVLSGVLDADEHWMPVERTKQLGWSAESKPVSESEFILIDGVQQHVRFAGEKIQRVEKALLGPGAARPLVKPHGAGRFVWSPLPLELSEALEPLAAFYRFALRLAGISPIFRVSMPEPSILILPALYEHAALYTFVSEQDRDAPLRLTHVETNTQISLTVPAERSALVLIDRRTGKVIDSMPRNLAKLLKTA
jgi:Cellulase (glycosyl hydrolase family 5)